jgi:hypothetical protein
MANFGLIFLVFAFVIACIASRPWWYSTPQPFNLLALAIAFWIASELIGGLAKSGILPH